MAAGMRERTPDQRALELALQAFADRALAIGKRTRELAVERLHVRALQEGRTDDTPEIIRHRLEVFHESTEPVVEYYRSKGILVGIHAERPIDAVFAEVQEVLETASTRP